MPNLINRNFNNKNKVWYTDVTYLIFKKNIRFLSVIIDEETKQILSWKTSEKQDWRLLEENLMEAVKKETTKKRKNYYSLRQRRNLYKQKK